MFIIILNGVNYKTEFTLLDYFSGEYTAYTSQKTGEDCVDLGFCYMNSQKVEGDVIGESMEIYNLEVGAALSALNARVIKTEYLEDGSTVIYAFTTLIEDKVSVDGENVNLQIASKDDRFIIGWPLIMGSY